MDSPDGAAPLNIKDFDIAEHISKKHRGTRSYPFCETLENLPSISLLSFSPNTFSLPVSRQILISIFNYYISNYFYFYKNEI